MTGSLGSKEWIGHQERDSGTMDPSTIIRNETNADMDAITEVTIAAFKTLEISNNTEQFVIMALRAAKALAVSLVAELDGRVIGHLALSPVTISDSTPNWYGLGPVSVLPANHRQGIGTALIQEGLSRLKDLGAAGCCVVGHPDYYRKFGFENPPRLVLEGVPAEVFLALSFDDSDPEGTAAFHEAFKADGQQGAEGDAPNRGP
jgi:putative acetyltransferase